MKQKAPIMEKALIVAGGEVKTACLLDELKKGYSVLVAADSGGKVLHENGYIPDILIGDFDSINQELLELLRTKGTKILEFPVEKDWTDLELAVETVINLSIQEIIIFGALGDRLDHSLGNLSLLYKVVENGIRAIIIGMKERVILLGPEGTIELSPSLRSFFSLVPLYPGADGVTVTKAKFPLKNAYLPFGSTRGIHNEFLGEPVTVSVREGYAFLIVRE